MEIAANLRHMLACGLRNRRCAFGRHGLLPVRRKFVTLLGGAATWPLAVAAQQPTVPMIGFLRSSSLAGAEHLVAAFRQGLNITGFVEGQNASGISFRPAQIADNIAAPAAKAAPTSIPIVRGGRATTSSAHSQCDRVNGPRNLPSFGPAIFPTLAGLVISRLSDR
jgi:hypothetical protein